MNTFIPNIPLFFTLLLVNSTLQSQVVTYFGIPATEINLGPADCFQDCCSSFHRQRSNPIQTTWGWSWTSTGSNIPVSATANLLYSIQQPAAVSLANTLNGNAQGGYSVPFNNSCVSVAKAHSLNPADYNFGAVNTWIITEPTTDKFQLAPITLVSNPPLVFSHADIVVDYGVLPIELTYFNAKIKKDFVSISWETASEINNNYFTIERSVNGIEWKALKNIDGAGNSNTTLNYIETDKSPLQGTSYYRLKQTDYDGRFSYSKVKSVNSDGEIQLAVYPNPAINIVNISANIMSSKEFKLLNVKGENMVKQIRFVSSSETETKLDVSNLPSGYYIIKLNDITTQFIKR